ncbi:MAG: acyl-CoA dehydrogenase [Gemmatimonadetes bacterium]|nr:acyl-CoA dehydrogenase [Gemmatimonadota bacterium]MYH53021.1 acyl-CoA dehydrogenase [Gemmatimonadota bacterium]MYK65443.1 acyl-CoA dehydrogenase [Gemmatimonadota bacterium]
MLNAEQREIRDLARDFAEGEIVPRAAAWDRDRAFDREVLDRLAELGFLGMLTPPEYGGLGFDTPTYLVAMEEIARGDAALALTVAIQNGPVPHILLTHGSEEQKTRWLPALASGQKIAAFALSEAEAGSDPSAMTTRAREDDGDWVISGSKKWVTNGSRADLAIVFARTGPVSARPPIGAFLVDTGAEGYRVGRREKTMGLCASETVSVALEGVRVGRERLVGDPGRALGYALGALDLGRLGIAAQAVGIGQAALEHATRYARERRQFGRPIADFGAIRSSLAMMASRIAGSRALVMEGAAAWEERGRGDSEGLPVTARSAMAKLLASETAMWVTEEAVRIFGGYGFMREFPVEKLMRDAKGTEIYEGTSEILRLVIGRALTRSL